MIADIVVPPHIPPEAAESYKEFCLAQQIQALLVKHKAGRYQAAMLLSYVMSMCAEQIDNPVSLQQGMEGISQLLNRRLSKRIHELDLDPAVRVRMNVGDRTVQRLNMRAALKEPLVQNITEDLFRVDPSKPAEEQPSSIILNS